MDTHPRRFVPSPWLTLLLWRQALPATAVAALAAAALALLWPGRLLVDEWLPARLGLITLAALHCLALAIVQGRPGSGTFAYLYTRGFSRDRLWCHHMLASTLSALTVVFAAGLVVWTPARAWYQDVMQLSPFYPGAAAFEQRFPLWALPVYVLLLPVLHYAWIRRAQSMHGRLSGVWLAMWLVIAVIAAQSRTVPSAVHLGLIGAAMLLLVWSWRLHRNVEVTR